MGSQAYNLRVAALRTLEFRVCEAFVDDPWDDETEEEESLEKLRPTPRLPKATGSFIAAVWTVNIRLCQSLPPFSTHIRDRPTPRGWVDLRVIAWC